MIFGFSAAKAALFGAIAAVIAGTVLYAVDADRAFVREKTRAALLEGAVRDLNATVKRYDEQRAEDQRKLSALGQREALIARALERARAEYATLAADFARLVSQDPVAAGGAVAQRLHDWMRRVGAADDRGAHKTD